MQRREVARYMVAFLFDGTASGLPAALTPLVSESTVSEQELLEPESGGWRGWGGRRLQGILQEKMQTITKILVMLDLMVSQTGISGARKYSQVSRRQWPWVG